MTTTTITALEHDACTGCGACANGCPYGSITMQADNRGFLYPQINGDTCSDCGHCVQSCPILSPLSSAFWHLGEKPIVYAAWSLDEEIRFNSTSGGVFSELAKHVLQQQGYVAGAEYTNHHLVAHTLIHAEDELPRLRQSKYIQSRTDDIYQKVIAALQKQKPVLFVGTPCQCVALQKLVGQQDEHLYLCDFICRGVNAPRAYQQYLQALEQQYHSKVKAVWFKDKSHSWNQFGTKITFVDGQEYFQDRDHDPFMYGYIKKNLNLYIRASCNQCKFKGINRTVDLTLGDFWGINLTHTADDMKQGVSAVLVHSRKGKQLFDAVAPNLYWEEKQIEDVLPGNRCLQESVTSNRQQVQEFWDKLHRISFSEIIDEIRRNCNES